MEFVKKPEDPFSNQICEWKIADSKEQYEKVKDQVSYGPNDITYHHNSDGFRCDEFINCDLYDKRILFAGCSLTEGIGLPLNDIWAKIIHTKICSKLNIEVPFWSIARGATGLDQMVRYLYHYLPIIKPNIVISYIPFFERRERWYNDFFGPWSDDVSNNESKVLLDEKYVNYITEKNFIMIDLLLERYNSTMLCSTVDHKYNIEHLNLRNVKQLLTHVPRIDLARDGIHAGPKTNRVFADYMLDNFWEEIKSKLNINTS